MPMIRARSVRVSALKLRAGRRPRPGQKQDDYSAALSHATMPAGSSIEMQLGCLPGVDGL
jgi:hypothetical protein